MQIGYATTFQNIDQRRSDKSVWKGEVRMSDLAVELGFDSIWSTEHHFTDYEMIPNPLQFLTFMAGRTDKCRLGTMVVVLPWHDPVRVIEEIAVLDNLTDGRFIFGMGRGLAAVEFEGFRIDMNETRERFNQSAAIILEALETGYVEADTSHFKIPRRAIRPRPIYSFHGRTFGAGGSTPSMPILAELGAGLLVVPTKEWDALESDAAIYREAWKRHHPDRAHPKPLLDQFIFVDQDPARAEAMARTHIGEYFAAANAHYKFADDPFKGIKGYEHYASGQSAAAPSQSADPGAIFTAQQCWGTPEQVIARLTVARERMDMSTVLGHFWYGKMELADAEASMTLFAEEVAPVLRSWGEPDPFATPRDLDAPAARAAE